MLLTIALLDWFAIPIGLISLIKHGWNADGQCADSLRVRPMSQLGVIMFVVRIFAQIAVFVRFKFCSNGWAYLSRPTFDTVEKEEKWKEEQQMDWERWRDQFQQLTFNSW
eukprot:COSAG06_NODE_26026_length_623_cov_1.217557_2_plen_110_part_00